MPRRKPNIEIANYGRYTTWNKKSRELPKLIKYTTTIPAVDGYEFGITINVDNLKGKVLDFIIKHPELKREDGSLMPQFKGELYVNTNHTQFFVGDGIWLPIDDKIGEWEIVIMYQRKVAVSKKFEIVHPELNADTNLTETS